MRKEGAKGKSMRRRSPLILGLVLAFLLAQWALVVHSHDTAAGGTDTACQTCLHGHHLKSAVLPQALRLPTSNPCTATDEGPSAPYFLVEGYRFHARAPPTRFL